MARPVATKRATAKSDAVKPDAAKPDESKTAAPNRVSNKKKPAYGTNDQTFKWQLGGLIVGVAVAMLASTQQGKEALRYVGLEDIVLRLMHGPTSAARTRSDPVAPEPILEIPPSKCLTSLCTVKVFNNGEHVGGKSIKVAPADMSEFGDVGELLGTKMECVSTGMRSDEPKHCKVYNGVGNRIVSMGSVEDGEVLYVVPQERSFVWPTIEIGRQVTVPHVTTPLGREVIVETLSHSPRVFSLHNFMDMEEAENIIHDALTTTREEYRLKRSSTGTKGNSVSKTRTSDNAFVTHTKTAQALKRRIFKVLGIEQYTESWADGLQVLRYNESQAYVAHYDYLESAEGHNFDSAGLGTNRFATVVLYFTDVKEGGETVFTKAPGIDHHLLPDTRVPVREVISDLGLPKGGWEEKLILQCRRNMITPAKRGTAVLFYNQHPDGRKDLSVEHGACPVIAGQKWAANLWVWNGPRYGMSSVDPETGRTVDLHGAGKSVDNDPSFKIEASFVNEDVEGASLYFSAEPWASGQWNVGQEHNINTYLSHKWVAKVDGKAVKTWIINERKAKQKFVLSKHDLA